MSEFEEARLLAERILERPYADPDDDLAMLARQFSRALEREALNSARTVYVRISREGTENDPYAVVVCEVQYDDGPLIEMIREPLGGNFCHGVRVLPVPTRPGVTPSPRP